MSKFSFPLKNCSLKTFIKQSGDSPFQNNFISLLDLIVDMTANLKS